MKVDTFFDEIKKTDLSRVILITAFFVTAFLILFELENNVRWGGETGHNYLQLKNYIESKEFPLKGPPTGRSWLWLGPLYFWIMIPLFLLFNFNPVIPNYFFALLLLVMAVVNFKFVKEWFNAFIATISTLFILLSPIWLTFARQARFYFLVTFFSFFYYYLLINGLRKNKSLYIYYSVFVLSIMLHFHYVSVILVPSFLMLIYSYRTKLKLKKSKLLIYFLIPSIPFFIVNIKESFVPVIKTAAWFPYRFAGFLGIIEKNKATSDVLTKNIQSPIIIFNWHFISNNKPIILSISIIILGYTAILFYRSVKKKKSVSLLVLTLSFWTSYFALFIHGNPPYHYYIPILLIFPVFIALFIQELAAMVGNNKKSLVVLFVLLILLSLNYSYYKSDKWFSNKYQYKNGVVSYPLQKLITQEIINNANGGKYTLKREGPFDYYGGYFAQNYQYLLWLKGNEPVENSKVVYTIYEGEKNKPNKNEIIYSASNIYVTKTKNK